MTEEEKEKAFLEMKRPSQELYDLEVNPLVEKLKKLEEKLLKTRRKAFDKYFCQNCKSNCRRWCAYESYWNMEPLNDKHIDKEGCYTRPVEECEFFKRVEDKGE